MKDSDGLAKALEDLYNTTALSRDMPPADSLLCKDEERRYKAECTVLDQIAEHKLRCPHTEADLQVDFPFWESRKRSLCVKSLPKPPHHVFQTSKTDTRLHQTTADTDIP